MNLKKTPKISQLAKDEKLIKMLVEQINKDLALAGVDDRYETKIKIEDLIKSLSLLIEKLFNGRYDSYLSLIYRVDVSEKEMIKINSRSKLIYEDLAKVILKRELQKVWFRSKF